MNVKFLANVNAQSVTIEPYTVHQLTRSSRMPFPSHGLPQFLIDELNVFTIKQNFPSLYKMYSWKNDTYPNHFPDILRLELQISQSDRTTGISLDDVKSVADWGRLRRAGQIAGPDNVLPALTLHTSVGDPQPTLQHNSTQPIGSLEQIRGIGPTYLSKVLRFGLPREYGAIDTRCVRVFGQGDRTVKQHNWLAVSAFRGTHEGRATGWSIRATQKHWPDGFAVWLNILRYLANALPQNCPHPTPFVSSGMRQAGVWTCADVEMALFSYASRFTA